MQVPRKNVWASFKIQLGHISKNMPSIGLEEIEKKAPQQKNNRDCCTDGVVIFKWLVILIVLLSLGLKKRLVESKLLGSSPLGLYGMMSKTALFNEWWGGVSRTRFFRDCEKWCKRSTAVPLLDGELAEASFRRFATRASAVA